MSRRLTASGKSATPRSPKRTKAKRSNKPNRAGGSELSASREGDEVARLTRELNDAAERQEATSDVLQVISRSPGDLQPVFAAMLGSATRICEAKFGNLFLREGEAFRAVAWHGERSYMDTWRPETLIIKTDMPGIPLARLAATKQRVHVADLKQEVTYKAGFPPQSQP